MTEWDKLWESEVCVLPHSQGVIVKESDFKRVKAVGDKLQEDALKYRRLQEEDPDASIILGDELTEACIELDQLREENKQLRTRISEYFFTTKEQEKKIEAIRKICVLWKKDCDNELGMIDALFDEPCKILESILEVLGE